MKRKIIGSILVIILCMQVLIPTVLGAQNVVTDEITTKTTDNDEEIHFEDTNLKNLLIKNANVDKDSNGIITLGELETLTELTINTQINSLKGLENAKNLATLKFDTDEAYIFSDNFFSSMSSIKNIEIKDIGNDNVKFLSNLTLESLTISNSKNVLDWSALKTASIKQLKLETIKLQDNSNLMEIVNSKELDNTEITCCIHYDVDLGEIKLNSSAVYELIDVAPVVYEYDNPDGRFKGNIDTHAKSSPSDFDDNLDIDGFNKTVTINTSRVGSTFSNVVLTPKAAPFNVEINFTWKIVADGDKSKEIVITHIKDKLDANIILFFISTLIIVIMGFISIICNFSYGMLGILMISFFYLFKENFPLIVISITLSTLVVGEVMQYFSLFSLILIYFYNKKLGKKSKLFFYLYYPVHILVLGIIRTIVG